MRRFLTLSPSPVPLPEKFDNADFINAFAQSFISFAKSLDPNVKIDPSNITPQWDLYDISTNKMVFNKTGDGVPDIQVKNVDSKLLERCRYVHPMPPVQEDAYVCTVTGRASRLQSGSRVNLGASVD